MWSNHWGTYPWILQLTVGPSLLISKTPPSSILWSLIPRAWPWAWHDSILHSSAPHLEGLHCWLDPPVLSHCTTFAYKSVLYPAISTHWPVKTLTRRYPFPQGSHLHLWLNLLFFYHWISLSPCSWVPPGMSRAFPEWELTMMQVLLRPLQVSTGTM